VLLPVILISIEKSNSLAEEPFSITIAGIQTGDIGAGNPDKFALIVIP